MEVALSGPQVLSEPLRKGTRLPLNQLVKESRSRGSIPNHLLESKIYDKLKSNSQVQAEPSELHFSGFELGKNYVKNLKLINISSEVMNIHIIPTLTKYFQTTYTKKYRLIPGLAYTLKVRFCPDEWRYFYDCIRVHCEGEENLLIPVHAYPVIDDLHIPTRIDLSAVPLGLSVCHTIPLRCSCPIDFEFQVHVIQPHEAFSIAPVTGVIPANGEAEITVIFCPCRYETCQVTFQLAISQFNTRPYLCTITGSSAPHISLSPPKWNLDHSGKVPAQCIGSPPVLQASPRSKNTLRLSKDADKLKIGEGVAQLGPTHLADVCTPAGVAKMLIKDINKLTSKDLKQASSCSGMAGLQSRQMKEALFIKKVNQAVKEEQVKHLNWQVHLGMDPMSEQTVRQIVEEREIKLHEYMVKRGDVRQDEDFPAGQTKLISRRVLRDAWQTPKEVPFFQFYTSKPWELTEQALRLFQQAARKVVIRCRMGRRLESLKKLAENMRNHSSGQKAEEKTCDLQISRDKVFPSSFPIFSNEDDLLALDNLVAVPVDPIDVTVTTHIPFFKLQVPQYYKLMGYQPVSAWEAFNSYIPTTLARPLRSETPDVTVENAVQIPRRVQFKAEEEEEEEEHVAAKKAAGFSDALLAPLPANPLRIFNPAPGLQAYKPQPKCLESDLEHHVSPLSRYLLSDSNMCCSNRPTQHKKTFLTHNHKEAFTGVMKWNNSISLTCLSNQPALISDRAPSRSIDDSTDLLPLTAPLPPTALLHNLPPLMDSVCEVSGLQLTPDMIRAEFLSGSTLVSHSNLTAGKTARSEISRMEKD